MKAGSRDGQIGDWRRHFVRLRFVRNAMRRTDEELTRAAEAAEESANRAAARGHVDKAERERCRAAWLREQLSKNAGPWFRKWSVVADELEAEARSYEAIGETGHAGVRRDEAEECRAIACRFDARAAEREFTKPVQGVSVRLTQETLDVLKELRVPIARGAPLLASIIQEAVYALQEMKVTDTHAAACWPVYFRFEALARQGQRPRSWGRTGRHVADSARIQFQLAKAEHGAA
jgi:hypothetical protein